MKLLFVIDSLGSGGAQRLFVNIVNGLSISHEITIFLYKPNSNFFLNQISPSVSVYSLKNQKMVLELMFYGT